ncbi:hypothetical protein [Fictibacillus phosphorivorans]|nr:hypothetical protein [Fictibacillus phosphorivorans]
MAQSGKWLTACPTESEHPGAEINYYQKAALFKQKDPRDKPLGLNT